MRENQDGHRRDSRKIRAGKYIVSFTHTEKVRLREIEMEEIEGAILQGAIIEPYPDDPRGPSCLIYGLTDQNRPLHIVCGRLEDDEILIITVLRTGFRRVEKRLEDEKEGR